MRLKIVTTSMFIEQKVRKINISDSGIELTNERTMFNRLSYDQCSNCVTMQLFNLRYNITHSIYRELCIKSIESVTNGLLSYNIYENNQKL